MLNTYKFTRHEIVDIIKSKEKTEDGFYWFPKFNMFNLDYGWNIDNFYFDREDFNFRLYFNERDLEAYLARDFVPYDIQEERRLALTFYERNRDIVDLDIKNYVPGTEYTLEEVIDTFNYIYNNRESD